LKYLSHNLLYEVCSKSELGQAMLAKEQNMLKEEMQQFTMANISNWMEGLHIEFLVILC
jgi:hypothetical protein